MNILTVVHEIQSAFLGVTLQYRCFLQSPYCNYNDNQTSFLSDAFRDFITLVDGCHDALNLI
jgi:hypothetical protein